MPARNVYIENFIAETQALLATTEIAAALGGQALQLSQQMEEAFIPNARSGSLAVPQEYRDTDKAAIIAIRPKANFFLGPGFNQLTPSQRAAVETTTTPWIADTTPSTPSPYQLIEDRMQEQLNQKWSFVSKDGNGNSLGNASFDARHWPAAGVCATFAYYCWRSDTTRQASSDTYRGLVTARPMVVLPYFGHKKSPTNPAVLVHEFVHVRQGIEQPLLEFDPTVGDMQSAILHATRKELEAYHTDNKIGQVREQQDPTYTRSPFSKKVEEWRQQYTLPNDPFYPHQKLCNLLGH